MKNTLKRLRDSGFLIQPAKSEFMKPEIHYLGYVITDKGIKPNPKKVEAIKKLKPPSTVKEIQQTLGLLTYYRKFVPEFSKLSKPLSQLLKKNIEFKWTTECQLSFEKLIEILTSELLLKYRKTILLEYRCLSICHRICFTTKE